MSVHALSNLIAKSLSTFGRLGDIFVDGDHAPAVAAAKNLQFLAQNIATTFSQEKDDVVVGKLRGTESNFTLNIPATFDVDGSITPAGTQQPASEYPGAWVFCFPSGVEVPVRFFPSDEYGSDPRWVVSQPKAFYSELIRLALTTPIHQRT